MSGKNSLELDLFPYRVSCEQFIIHTWILAHCANYWSKRSMVSYFFLLKGEEFSKKLIKSHFCLLANCFEFRRLLIGWFSWTANQTPPKFKKVGQKGKKYDLKRVFWKYLNFIYSIYWNGTFSFKIIFVYQKARLSPPGGALILTPLLGLPQFPSPRNSKKNWIKIVQGKIIWYYCNILQ